MEFIVRECPNNGILGGPFEKTITAYIGQQHSLAEISIEQFGERIITVHTVEDASIYDLHHLYFDLKRLIMLMDGQFYPITSVTQDGVEITTSIQKKLLPNYFSADFMIGENNRLINFDEVLSETLFSNWCLIQEELDIVHNTALYCLSRVEMPVDMKCAFLIEAFIGVGEIIQSKKSEFVLPKRKSREESQLGLDADDYDLLAVDYLMWDEILPLAEKKSPVSPATPEVKKPVTVKDSKSLHDEIKEKLVAIGELLGFDSRSEVKITTGAVVDAVWEAKIGNMGKAIYVFEVQSKGSIDSLILNLKKAQSNAAVQAVVAVADEEQLAKIIQESAGVIDEKSLRTWDSEDVLAVYDSLVRAHESINKLALVPENF